MRVADKIGVFGLIITPYIDIDSDIGVYNIIIS